MEWTTNNRVKSNKKVTEIDFSNLKWCHSVGARTAFIVGIYGWWRAETSTGN